jgi:hypothetical protein
VMIGITGSYGEGAIIRALCLNSVLDSTWAAQT